MKIYTKTGDSGETGFIGGRVSKASDLTEVLGDLDELNAALGYVVSLQPKRKKTKVKPDLNSDLEAIQATIFELGAIVASPQASLHTSFLGENLPAKTADLESLIDLLDESLPALQNFILPGGAPTGAALHLARSVCRRAERSIVRLFTGIDFKSESEATYERNLKEVEKYINRLSDYLFTLARWANARDKIHEQIWRSSEQMSLKL